MHKIKKVDLVISVIQDRILNICGLATLVVTSGLVFYTHTTSNQGLFSILHIGLSLASVILIGFISFIFLQPISNIFPSFIKKLIHPFLNLSSQFHNLLKYKKQNLKLIFHIYLSHLLSFFSIYFIIKSMGLNLPITELFTPILIVLLISAFPITPGGWGIRESVMITTLQQFNVQPHTALAISILFGINLTIASISPSLLWYLDLQIKKIIQLFFIKSAPQ